MPKVFAPEKIEKFFQPYRVNWSWNRDTEEWLRSLLIGRTLNFPCGLSRLGDVRADLDPSVKPDVVADLTRPKDLFAPMSFDTVLCDPPFSLYRRRRWIYELSDLARKRIIFSTPLVALKFSPKNWRKTVYAAEQNSPFFLRMFQVFDRVEQL